MSQSGFWSHHRPGVVPGGMLLMALTLVPVTGAARQEQSVRPHRVTIHEFDGRQLATRTTLPEFPKDALQSHAHGVAVVEVTFGVDGRVAEVRPLQAPDAACESAVVRAVRQWEFKSLNGPNGRPAIVTTKLTFYFEIDARGRRTVSEPKLPTGNPNKDAAGRLAGSIDAAGTTKLARQGRLLIVDVRPRELSRANLAPGTVALPLDEIATRAPECAGVRFVVIACYPTFEAACDAAAREIVRFTDVARVFVGPPPSPQKRN